jgi:cell division septum initiation protein DivIVA
MAKSSDDPKGEVDLDEVRRMLDALERDLPKVRGGSQDVQVLRDEVDRLRALLESPGRRHHSVREALHSLRLALEDGMEAAVGEGVKLGQYVALIGRILGL